MAWCRPDDKPLSEPMMASLPMHIWCEIWCHAICVTSLQPKNAPLSKSKHYFALFVFGPLNLMLHWASKNISYLFFRKRLSMQNLEISFSKLDVTWHHDSLCFEFFILSAQINNWMKIVVFIMVCYLTGLTNLFIIYHFVNEKTRGIVIDVTGHDFCF